MNLRQFNFVFALRFQFKTVTSGSFRDFFVDYFTSNEGYLAELYTQYPLLQQPEAKAAKVGKGKGKKGKANLGGGSVTKETADTAAATHTAIRKAIEKLPWDALLCEPGIPAHPIPDFSNSLSAKALALAELIIGYSRDEFAAGLDQIRGVDISVTVCLFICI